MISSLPQANQDELEQLATRYGRPLMRTADLRGSDFFDPLYKTDRYGEVCMVLRRPNGRLLTMKKHFYPADTYRLPTGGIHHGEQIFDALLRETYEETGLEVSVSRFLAIATYRTSDSNEAPIFYSFAFLLDEVSGTLGVVDEDEQVEAFREIEPHELPSIADYLTQLDASYSEEVRGSWRDWGEFRAVIHRLVYEALT
ncbi:MAG TPA: NUDIX hydrolase [Ktedonobacteraceae bacterium]|nr:NUDIX hydrolase [Ktedonobacteraceae bacterium]